MNIPVFQSNQFTEANGFLTHEQQMWFDNFIQTLQNGIGPFGFTVTADTTVHITTYAQKAPVGTVWFDTDVKKLKVLTSSSPITIETISSS
jgi:hypothetical protein